MAGGLIGSMRYANGMEKGPRRRYRYYKTDKRKEPEAEEDYTMEDFVAELVQQIEGKTQPDGSKEFPAKNCKDLKLAFPEIKDGLYHIDPNGQQRSDAFTVRCVFSGNSGAETCVEPSGMGLPEKEGDTLWWHKFEYPANSVQLEMLRMESGSVRQNFTFQCKRVQAHLRVIAADDVEMTAGKRSVLQVLHDTCSKSSDSWQDAAMEVDTPLKSRLPIADVGVFMDDVTNGEFTLQMGAVCFT